MKPQIDHKNAMEELVRLLKKYNFTPEEKDAIMDAIGVLSWYSLAQGKIKAMKEKKNKLK